MSSYSGTLHNYAPRLVAFEFPSTSSIPHGNKLLFVGGLGDGLLTVPYVSNLAVSLDRVGWSVVQLLLSSSYTGWGAGSLARDTTEIEKAIVYFRRRDPKAKIVLMGHSTGSQDTISYLSRHQPSTEFGSLDGGILQAPVSDREAMQVLFPDQAAEMCEFAASWETMDRSFDFLPKRYSDAFFGTPITAYRWLSLARKGGDDDYFSSDIDHKELLTTFGIVRAPICVLISGSDEFMPSELDKQDLLRRWQNATNPTLWSSCSAVIQGATHNLGETSKPGAQDEVIAKVARFLSTL
ncbi:uncharacterized protein V1516DRAFT_679939 [Lipomyces oligophaga]|uniref:uncharacterized protein n=1 Tax=Lipomyces oligophaga TaxID=45792 RepID=UPI0034CEF41A